MAKHRTDGSVTAKLNYNRDDGTRPCVKVLSAADMAKGDTAKGGVGGPEQAVDVSVANGRGKGLRLDTHSFELVEHPTGLSTEDFYEAQDKVRTAYYAEMRELLMRETGAAFVKVLHHQVRCAERANGNPMTDIASTVQPYAQGVHCDSSAFSAQATVKHMLKSANVDPKFGKGRFLYVNTWRNISESPIESYPLAMCDESSLVSPEDYIASDFAVGEMKIVQYKLDCTNSSRHRWYYFPGMSKDEVVLFKQWDSNPDVPGRMCFHTAFRDPTSAPDARPRESIECRALCFFPDFTPDTMAHLVPDDDGSLLCEGESQEVRRGVSAVTRAVQDFSYWPAVGVLWAKAMAGDEGKLRSVAETLVQDTQGYLGTAGLSDEVKKRIVELVMEKGEFAERVKRGTAQYSYSRLLLGPGYQKLWQSKAAWAAAAFAAGYALRAWAPRRS